MSDDPRVEVVCAEVYDEWGDDERAITADILAVADAVDPARVALADCYARLNSLATTCAAHPEILDAHESIRYVYVDVMNSLGTVRSVLGDDA